MNSIHQISDLEFENKFQHGNLDPAAFNHEAHLRLAWIHVTKYGSDQAEANIKEQLYNFVKAAGAIDKYNTTLTISAIKAVAHFVSKTKSTYFNSFISEFPRLKSNFKDLIAQHYSFDIFNSEVAKANFLEPDLLPFE